MKLANKKNSKKSKKSNNKKYIYKQGGKRSLNNKNRNYRNYRNSNNKNNKLYFLRGGNIIEDVDKLSVKHVKVDSNNMVELDKDNKPILDDSGIPFVFYEDEILTDMFSLNGIRPSKLIIFDDNAYDVDNLIEWFRSGTHPLHPIERIKLENYTVEVIEEIQSDLNEKYRNDENSDDLKKYSNYKRIVDNFDYIDLILFTDTLRKFKNDNELSDEEMDNIINEAKYNIAILPGNKNAKLTFNNYDNEYIIPLRTSQSGEILYLIK
jgi:hypothetical protein